MNSYAPPPRDPDRDVFWWVPVVLVSLPMMLLFAYEFFFYAFVRDACGYGGNCPEGVAAPLRAVPVLYLGGAVFVLLSASPPWRKSYRLLRYVIAVAGLALSASPIWFLLEAQARQ